MRVCLLRDCPVNTCWAQKSPSSFMVKSTIIFGFAIDGRDENLVVRGDPINNRAFHPFRIIGTGRVSAFLYLNTIQSEER